MKLINIREQIDTAPLGALPRAYYALKNSTHLPTVHETLDLRHPSSIYSLSLSTIRDRIDKLLALLVPISSSPDIAREHRAETDAALCDATDAFLDALMEHFDDCCNVMKCYLDSGSDKLKKEVFAIVQGGNWDAYRGHTAKIVNFIKHKQRRVRSIVFTGQGWSTPGFFIEGPAGPKTLGPDPQIHPTGGTAFSYRRNIMFHICGVYAISRSLAVGLAKVDKSFVQVTPEHKIATNDEITWTATISRLSSLSPFVFPDELRHANPIVRCAGSRVTVQCPSNEKPRAVPRSGNISTLFTPDAMSPTYRLPYLASSDRTY